VPAALPSDDAVALENGLTSTDPKKVEVVLADELRTSYAASPEPLLPEGSTLRIDTTTMSAAGSLGQVQANVTGSEPGRYLLLLVRLDNHWLLYGTKKL
jgi:hypothetical protein